MESTEEILRIEDWDHYRGLNIEDEKPLVSPLADIRDGLDSALAGEFQFDGTFAHSTTYFDAPNPCLHLEGLGPIGLPLNDVQIRMIIESSTPGIIAEAEQGVWKFPGDKITFEHAPWNDWFKKTAVASLHTSLDASVSPNVAEQHLKYLVIRGPHTGVTEGGRQYGYLSIILPSRHSGGDIHFTYQGKEKAFTTTGQNVLSTIAIGAYSTVKQSLDPVQSGYVVYLYYELSCLSEAHVIPRLPELVVGNTQLHHVFRSWRQILDSRKGTSPEGAIDIDGEEGEGEEQVPDLLICLLEREYSTVTFKAASLQGADRLMLTQIAPFAKSYGFDLHLAKVVYTESGGASLGKYGRSRHHGYGCGYGCCGCDDSDDYSDEDIDADDLEMEDTDEYSIEINNVVALDGMPLIISGSVVDDLVERNDNGQLFVNGCITDRTRSSDFERYDRESGTLTHTYSSKVFLITPTQSPRVRFSIGAIGSFASQALVSSLSETPTLREHRLVEALLEWVKTNTLDAVGLTRACSCLRESADRWNDVGLFLRLLESSYQAFDWGQLQEKYTEAFVNESSNDLRMKIVDRLLATATSNEDSVVIEWCNTQREESLRTLQKLDIREVDSVASLLLSKKNSTQYLRDTFLPHLRTIQPSDVTVWTALLARLQEATEGFCQVDKDEMLQIIQDCVRHLASTAEPFPTCKKGTGYGYYFGEADTVEPILDILRLCIRFNTLDTINGFFTRMWNGRAAQDAAHPQRLALCHYTSLVNRVPAILKDQHPHVKRSCAILFEQAFQLLLPNYQSNVMTTRAALQNMEDPISALKQWLTADCLKKMDRRSVEDLAKWVSNTLRSKATTQESQTQVREALELCLRRAVGAFDVLTLGGYSPYSTSSGIDLLEFCFTIQLPSRVNIVLAKFLQPPKAREPDYIKKGLVSVLKGLPGFLDKHKHSLRQPPFSIFAAEVTRGFIRHVLGQKPAEAVPINELKAVGCGCIVCNRHLIPFLIGQDKILSVREKQSVRTHIEQRIEKPQRLVAMGQWPSHQIEAQAILKILGSTEDQQQILGKDYHWVVGVVSGTAALPPMAEASVSSTASNRMSKRPLTSQNGGNDPKKPRTG
ncbi:hypothetical protein VNI00_015994 [Paramarasmius palmivorus]|uniref:Uncharacterized protein n=1 Tax=Paramarasmius palmivorus TaxID=297713 RepID=A0AAW0BHX6_9AGAR